MLVDISLFASLILSFSWIYAAFCRELLVLWSLSSKVVPTGNQKLLNRSKLWFLWISLLFLFSVFYLAETDVNSCLCFADFYIMVLYYDVFTKVSDKRHCSCSEVSKFDISFFFSLFFLSSGRNKNSIEGRKNRRRMRNFKRNQQGKLVDSRLMPTASTQL